MTLYDVVKKNVLGSFKHYLIYFISMIASVVIYFTFVSLQYSKEIKEALELSENLNMIFMGASAILVFFVAVFVWYSNSFFMKRRRREIGLYALLGVRKRTIGVMLFLENIAMGLAALAIGVAIGILLSKLFFMIVVRMIGAAVVIDFALSGQAILHTAVVFTIIALLTSLQGYRIVYRFKLAELFRPESEGQLSPRMSAVSAVTAIVLIGIGYWFSWQPFRTNEEITLNWGVFLACTVAGTMFLFNSLIIFLLRLSQKNKRRYYRGINLVGTAQLMYRVRSNARTFTLIALLSAVTISMLSTIFSQYYTNAVHAADAQPFSFTHLSLDEASDREAERILMEDAEHPVKLAMDIPVLQAEGDLSESFEGGEDPVRVISASTYNTIAQELGWDAQVELTGQEAAFIRPFYTVTDDAAYRGHVYPMQMSSGAVVDMTFVALLDQRVLSWLYPDLVVVISDELFTSQAAEAAPVIYKAYEVEGEKSSKSSYMALSKTLREEHKLTSYYYTYKSGLEETGVVTFIATFLGIVFLAATGSVIYFKQLTEAQADRGRYDILRKIGAGKKEIRATIAKQMLFVFGLPLAVGILHGSMLLHALTNLISQLIGVNVLVPILIAISAYVIIYAGYYSLTVVSYNRIVNR
jgi:putative ABC transport system permease protein